NCAIAPASTTASRIPPTTQPAEVPEPFLSNALAGTVVVVVVLGGTDLMKSRWPAQARGVRGGATNHFLTGTTAPGPIVCGGSPTHALLPLVVYSPWNVYAPPLIVSVALNVQTGKFAGGSCVVKVP